VISKEKGK